MELGRSLGNYLGGKQPEKILDIRRIGDTAQVRVHWPQNGRTESVEHLFVTGKRKAVVGLGQVSGDVQLNDTNRAFIEVLSAGPLCGAEEEVVLRKFLEDTSKRRVRLTWTVDQEEEIGLQGFRVYGNGGAGGAPTILIAQLEPGAREFTTNDLAAGTWKFKVNPFDAAGNEAASALEVTVEVPEHVEPPAPLVTLDVSGTLATVAWGASPTSGVTAYRVYSNHGAGFPDFSAPFAEVSGASFSASGTVTAGDWIFIVRAVKGTAEEDNFDHRVEGTLVGPPPLRLAGALPNPVSFLGATSKAGGKIEVVAAYLPLGEKSKGRKVRLYVAPSDTPLDFSVPTEELDLPDHALGEGGPLTVSKLLGPLAEDEYQIVARVANSLGDEERSTEAVLARSDATPPAELASLEGGLV